MKIFIGRGAEVINELLKLDLIDEYIISIIPILLGNGTRLFKDGMPEQLLELISSKSFDTDHAAALQKEEIEILLNTRSSAVNR